MSFQPFSRLAEWSRSLLHDTGQWRWNCNSQSTPWSQGGTLTSAGILCYWVLFSRLGVFSFMMDLLVCNLTLSQEHLCKCFMWITFGGREAGGQCNWEVWPGVFIVVRDMGHCGPLWLRQAASLHCAFVVWEVADCPVLIQVSALASLSVTYSSKIAVPQRVFVPNLLVS